MDEGRGVVGGASVFAGTRIAAEARAGKFPKYLEIKIIKRKQSIWQLCSAVRL